MSTNQTNQFLLNLINLHSTDEPMSITICNEAILHFIPRPLNQWQMEMLPVLLIKDVVYYVPKDSIASLHLQDMASPEDLLVAIMSRKTVNLIKLVQIPV